MFSPFGMCTFSCLCKVLKENKSFPCFPLLCLELLVESFIELCAIHSFSFSSLHLIAYRAQKQTSLLSMPTQNLWNV